MNRMPIMMMVLWLLLATGVAASLPSQAAGESVPQERLAYLELTRVRPLCSPNAGYPAYRDALRSAREYVWLLRDGSANVELLRKAMDYYEEAFDVWNLQADNDFPVDSLRTDEANGAAILKQCPDIARFHYKWRDQIYVKDAVSCLCGKAAAILDQAPAELR